MAEPTFIYAFDNLGPQKFTDLCNVLLAARYKGFHSGSVGQDGGIDGQITDSISFLDTDQTDYIKEVIINENDNIIFQFKHKTVARIGAGKTRNQLLKDFKGEDSEVLKKLVRDKKTKAYILITNLEINPLFRNEFIELCKKNNPEILSYEILGIDDIVNWLYIYKQIAYLYFPTIFGYPKYNLKIKYFIGGIHNTINFNKHSEEYLIISILNIGELDSYISSFNIEYIENNEKKGASIIEFYIPLDNGNIIKKSIMGICINPSRNFKVVLKLNDLQTLFAKKNNVFLLSFYIVDEIDNEYREKILPDLSKRILNN